MNELYKKYKIISKIGAGVYGVVYKAKCLNSDNKLVAVKTFLFNDDGIPQTSIRKIITRMS